MLDCAKEGAGSGAGVLAARAGHHGDACGERRSRSWARPDGRLGFSSGVGPGGGSAAQVMSWVVLPVFLPFLLILVFARMAVVRAGSPAGQQAQGVLRG